MPSLGSWRHQVRCGTSIGFLALRRRDTSRLRTEPPTPGSRAYNAEADGEKTERPCVVALPISCMLCDPRVAATPRATFAK